MSDPHHPTQFENLPVDGPDGASSHLSVCLEGPPPEKASAAVLYLHGFGSYQEGEKALYFRRRFRELGLPFCSLDFQGHGRSGGSITDITLTRNLADVRRAHERLREHGYRRLVVVGSSFGALTGLWYSALHPEGILGGLYIAPALELAAGLRAMAGAMTGAGTGEGGVEKWQREGTMRFASEQGEADLAWGLVTDLEAHPAERLAEAVSRPALILQGQRDDRVPWQGVSRFAAACRRAPVELLLFNDGDHRLVDRKDRLWEAMRSYLRRLLPEPVP